MSQTGTETFTEAAEKKLETMTENITEGKVDSLDGNIRYLGYLARAKTILIASSRYIAYTSDVCLQTTFLTMTDGRYRSERHFDRLRIRT